VLARALASPGAVSIAPPVYLSAEDWKMSIDCQGSSDTPVYAVHISAPTVHMAAEAFIRALWHHHLDIPLGDLPNGVDVFEFSYDNLMLGERTWSM
jgi:hypothetical protein